MAGGMCVKALSVKGFVEFTSVVWRADDSI
jgi:hypothetical protein